MLQPAVVKQIHVDQQVLTTCEVQTGQTVQRLIGCLIQQIEQEQIVALAQRMQRADVAKQIHAAQQAQATEDAQIALTEELETE